VAVREIIMKAFERAYGAPTSKRRPPAACPGDAAADQFPAIRPIRTASATQVRRPIYNNAVGRWRVYEEQIGPLLTALGVQGAPRRPARGATRQPA
jgi:hypothetical protein